MSAWHRDECPLKQPLPKVGPGSVKCPRCDAYGAVKTLIQFCPFKNNPDGSGESCSSSEAHDNHPCKCTCREPLTRTEVVRLRKLLGALDAD